MSRPWFARRGAEPAPPSDRTAPGETPGADRTSVDQDGFPRGGRAGGGRTSVGEDLVILTLPATSAYLAVLRTAAAGLAARLRFTLDEIEDLRIAVDEACALLLAAAVPDSLLTCRFMVHPDHIAVQVEVPSLRTEAFGRDSFAWTVLTALAGEVAAEAVDGMLSVRLVKARGSG